jgi:mannosyltransferase OCH1-like enzyme
MLRPFSVGEERQTSSFKNSTLARSSGLMPTWSSYTVAHNEKIQFWNDISTTSSSTFTSTTSRKHYFSYYVWEANICFAARHFLQAGGVKKHILITYLNENRGAFSRDAPNRTAVWDHLATHWSKWGCTDEEIWTYLDHPNTRAVFTTQHQSYSHPKVHSFPLGVYPLIKGQVLSYIKKLPHPQERRTQLLMINDNGWRHRVEVTQAVMANFNYDNYKINNTYAKGKGSSSFGPYLEELQRSKFILAPSGLGWDCYRIWEALYMGTIPIIEMYNRSVDGWRRSLEDLPVLWVQYYNDATRELLNEEYLRIAANAQNYKYEKLTRTWWVDFIRSFVPEDEDHNGNDGTSRVEQLRRRRQQEQSTTTTPMTTQEDTLTTYSSHYDDEGPDEIPRILHFVYVTPGLPLDQSASALPMNAKANIDGWQKLHPTWTVIMWNNTVIRKEFPDLVPTLEQIQTMSWVSNLVRYHALERHGGVYVDVDIEPIRPIDLLLRLLRSFTVCEKPASEGLLLNSTNDYKIRHKNCELINNAVIGVPKHHPVMKDTIHEAMVNTQKQLKQNPQGRYKLKTCGPPVWTKIVKTQQHSMNILHPSLFFPCSWSNKLDCKREQFLDEPHVYGVHSWTMSWYKP